MIDGGDTFRQAKFLGTSVVRRKSLSGPSITATLDPGETNDWFRFRVRGSTSSKFSQTSMSFAGNGAMTMSVFKASKAGKPGRVVARLNDLNSQRTLKVLPPGNYFVQVASSSPPASSSGDVYIASINLTGGFA